MKLSIVTTCLNAKPFISETIESIIGQRGDFDLEYILVDGGSTDGTVEKIQRLVDRHCDGRLPVACRSLSLQFVSRPDNGMYDGIARGFEMAGGEVVAYLNADDYYLPNALSTVAEIFSTHKEVNWITGLTHCSNASGQNTSHLPPRVFKQSDIRQGLHGTVAPFIQQEGTFWRNELLKRIDMESFKACRLAGDYYLWRQFADQTPLYTVNAFLASFRRHPANQSAEMSDYRQEFDRIRGHGRSLWERWYLGRVFKLKAQIFPLPSFIGNHGSCRIRGMIYFNSEAGVWQVNPWK